MTTYLYFDTETSDYHEDKLPAFPVELALILERDDRILTVLSLIVTARGWVAGTIIPIAQRVIDIHGIDQDLAGMFGIAPDVVLNLFRMLVSRADVVVGHNLSFDLSVMNHAFASQQLPPLAWPSCRFDTMIESAPILQLPSRGRYSIGGYKAPKLGEAYRHFNRGKELQRAHSALADTYATRLIHRAILRLRTAQPKEEKSAC